MKAVANTFSLSPSGGLAANVASGPDTTLAGTAWSALVAHLQTPGVVEKAVSEALEDSADLEQGIRSLTGLEREGTVPWDAVRKKLQL